jgi:hypothetical protein
MNFVIASSGVSPRAPKERVFPVVQEACDVMNQNCLAATWPVGIAAWASASAPWHMAIQLRKPAIALVICDTRNLSSHSVIDIVLII